MPRSLFLIVFSLSFVSIHAQTNIDSLETLLGKSKEDTSQVNVLNALSGAHANSSVPDDCIEYGMRAKNLAEQIDYHKGLAYAYKSIGFCYFQMGNYTECLTNWNQSLEIFKEIKDLIGEANLLSNISVVYKNFGDNINALEYSFKSLKVAEQSGDKLRIATAMLNIGAAYFDTPIMRDKALPYYLRAVKLCEEIDNKKGIGISSVNIGEIYFEQGNMDQALLYFEKSRAAFDELDDFHSLPYTLSNMGKVYAKKGDYTRAINVQTEAYQIASENNFKYETSSALAILGDTYRQKKDYTKALEVFHQAKVLAEEVGSLIELKGAYEGLVSTYSDIADFKNAFHHQELLSKIKDELFSEENAKTIQRFQFEFDLEKKQAQINMLIKDKEVARLTLVRQRLNLNFLFVGLGVVLAISIYLYRNNKVKQKTNKLLELQNEEIKMQKEEISAHLDDIERQKSEIEKLMLNILPLEVAQELRKTGRATPRYYDSVSILFTDFKEFTLMAEALSAEELVVQLNECFIAFDDIIGQFGLEKIKTIGDAYMCAGGIPSPDNEHPVRTVEAGLAIQKYICRINEARKQKGETPWELRIGIHTGPIVAGVVGHRKFAYDIWGSSVNLAARMEAGGEVGKVNISDATYQLVKHRFTCIHRGKVNAKNVGEIDMYFVDGQTRTS